MYSEVLERINSYEYPVTTKTRVFRADDPDQTEFRFLSDFHKTLGYPGIYYNTIQVNNNRTVPKHTDADRTALIVGLGHYTDGELCFENGNIDIREKPLLFDSRKPHWVNQWTGDRYSVTYFNSY